MWCPGTCRRVRATGAPLLPVVHPRPRTRRPDTYEPQGAIELLVVSDPFQPLTAAYSPTASRRVGESRLRRLGVLATMWAGRQVVAAVCGCVDDGPVSTNAALRPAARRGRSAQTQRRTFVQ